MLQRDRVCRFRGTVTGQPPCAGAVREFFVVTLPGLRNEILVAVVLTTINALRSFDVVYNTTAGGPAGETLIPSMYMYQNAFLYNRVGYAAAIATVLAVAIFLLAAVGVIAIGRIVAQ